MMQYFLNRFKIFALIWPILLLTGCGFHVIYNDGLKEKYPQVFLQSKANSNLNRQIKLRLRGAGIEIVDIPSDSVTMLIVSSEQRSSRTISLYLDATTAETELGYTLSYSITPSGSNTREFSVNLYRDFLENSSEALAKSRESELLTKEFRGIAADHIINTMITFEMESCDHIENSNEGQDSDSSEDNICTPEAINNEDMNANPTIDDKTY